MHTKTLNFKVNSFLPFLMYVQSIEVQANRWYGLHKQVRSVSGSFLLIHSVGFDESQACQLLCWTISRNCEKNQYGTKSQKKKTDDFYKNIDKYPLCCMSHKKTKQKKTQNFWSTCQSCSYSSNHCFKTLGLAFHDGFYINEKEFPEESLKNVKKV